MMRKSSVKHSGERGGPSLEKVIAQICGAAKKRK